MYISWSIISMQSRLESNILAITFKPYKPGTHKSGVLTSKNMHAYKYDGKMVEFKNFY